MVRTARLRRHDTHPPRPDPPVRAWTEQLQRIAFALGAVAFVLACLLGVAESFRSDRRLPAANVLADGPAEHIETLLRNRQFAQAIRDLAQYESMSNDRLPHERMRDVLSQLDPEARREVADILREYPRYRQGHFLLAYAFLLADEYEGAQREFEEVLRTQPKHAEAHNGLGLALAYQGHGEESAAEFWQALRLRPDLEEPRYNLRHIEPLLERSPSRTP